MALVRPLTGKRPPSWLWIVIIMLCSLPTIKASTTTNTADSDTSTTSSTTSPAATNCSNTACLSEQFCNMTSGKCLTKSGFGGPCNSSLQCMKTLTCNNNICGCKNSEFLNSSSQQCQNKSLFGQPCNTSLPCMETLTCNSNICGCKNSEFLNSSSQQCQNKSLFGQPCSTSLPCMETLTCNNNICGCKDSEFLNSSSQCQNKYPIGQQCTDDIQCVNTSVCQNNAAGSGTRTCQCKEDSYAQDDKTCALKRNYSESCSRTGPEECRENSTVCKDNNKTPASKMCLCDQSTYRTDNNRCISRDYLIVGNINHTSQTTQVSLHWEDRSQRSNVSYTITWTSSGKNINASKTGGNVDNLQPGTPYNFTVTGALPSDDYYEKIEMQSSQYTVWTYPAKPGLIVGVPALQNNSYIITFGESDGNVSHYRMVVTWVDEGGGKEEQNTSGPTVTVTFYLLKPGKFYSYNITAYNGNGDSSETVSGSFNTNVTAPGPVQQLNVTALDYKANVSWVTPADPNGNITDYLVQVKDVNESCLYMIWITCSDCDQQNNFSHEGCDVENGTSYTSAELQNKTQRFVLELTKLKAYHNYTVEVTAGNDAGTGSKVPYPFRTEEAAANTVTSVTLNSSRDSNDLISLNISWTSGVFTGPTTYYITVQESHGLESKEDPETYSVEGYDNKTYVVPNVLAFWNYTVYITAGTGKGNSTRSLEQTIQTVPSRPGTVTNLTVEQDEKIAKKLNISFLCPEERKRNGTITTFMVKQTLLGSNNSSESNLTKEGDLCKDRFININVWKDIVVQRNYTFQIKTFNQECAGDYGDIFSLYLEPKVPQLKESMKKFDVEKLISKSNKGDEETKISVVLCAPCLTDKSQGIVRNVGLIVCVGDQKCPQSGRKKRSTISFGDFKNWNTAKQQNFQIRYRATPDNWNQTLEDQGQNKQYLYVIGVDTSCDATSYCNGPLPSGSKVYISVVVCTDAGCDVYDESEVFMTAEPGNNVGAIVGGVLGGLALILVIGVIIFLIMRYRRRPGSTRTSTALSDINSGKELVIKQKRPIKMRDFKDHVTKLHKDSNLLFQDEFEDLKKLCMTFKTTCVEAQREANRVKNRYVDILPFDHSRVKLNIPPEGDETMDFINANYIPGYNSVREYIATQGPMHCTVPDFWQMAWEQKCKVIVMLSDLMENGKRKVDLYWPEDLNEPINFGSVVVEMTNFSQLNKYVIRNFKVSKGSESRRMTHFFLYGWEDFSANLSADIVLEFTRLVRQEVTPADSGPVIVHCSAGVGRTGTLIALDYFTQYIDKHSLDDEIDIFDYVLKMRKNRPRMVQAESQYIFIFDVLKEVILKKIKSEEEKLYENMKPNNGVYANFDQKEENIYANSNVREDKYVYNNEAFEPDLSNIGSSQKTDKPMTEL